MAADEFDASDGPLVRYFHETILPSIAYVERRNLETGELTSAGTATVIGVQGNPNDGYLPLLMTAAHLVEGDGEPHEFKLLRFNPKDVSKPPRVATFRSTDGPRSPNAFYYSDKDKEFADSGFIRGPLRCDDGELFFMFNEKGEMLPNQFAVMEFESVLKAEGTELAWAGFPYHASAFKRPWPCYFRGCVSALVQYPDYPPYYLVDGHNSKGVSGGPVWAMSESRGSPVIIGAVSAYSMSVEYEDEEQTKMKPFLPGLVVVTPTLVLAEFLRSQWNAKTGP